MENTVTTERIYHLENTETDYSLSSLAGLSVSVVTFLFAMIVLAFQSIVIHFSELMQGNFHIHGDPTLLYFAIFLVSATMLLLIQHHFQQPIEDEE